MAAVLAIGLDAVLSLRAAGGLYGMRRTRGEKIDVTVPRRVPSRSTIRVHHAVLPADEMTIVRGIPVTTPSRTLLDLAAVVTPAALERALNQADVLHLSDQLSLDDVVRRHRGHRGVQTARLLLEERGMGITKSDLEDAFHDFLATTTLPRPELNASLHVAGHWLEPDGLWREQRVIAECDGYDTHSTRAAFENDRARDRSLQAAGWRVVRITWRHVRDTPATLEHELQALVRPRSQ